MTTRRSFLFRSAPAAALATLTATWRSPARSEPVGLAGLEQAFAAIEAESGGRLGVAVLTGSGASAGYRAEERFPLCSTFKALAAAAILARVDAGTEQLERRIPVAQADILSYAPVAKRHVGGEMTLADLCEAAVTVSDNTAANLLLEALGGPAAFTAFVRTLGDASTRLDRMEPDLNEAMPGDPRDTTTPAAMARDMLGLSTGTALSAASRERLNGWLIACTTGTAKLRAGLPADWHAGDKTGSGSHGTSNDVAVIWPPGRPPLVIASYLTQTPGDDGRRNGIHAAVARAVAALDA